MTERRALHDIHCDADGIRVEGPDFRLGRFGHDGMQIAGTDGTSGRGDRRTWDRFVRDMRMQHGVTVPPGIAPRYADADEMGIAA